MEKPISLFYFAAAILLLSTASSVAADPHNPYLANLPLRFGQQGPAGGGLFLLLRMPDVHQELSITNQQRQTLQFGMRTRSREKRELFESILAGRVFQQPTDPATVRFLLAEFSRETEEILVSGALTIPQTNRLSQLLLQMQGIAALRRDDVADSLQLTPLQRQQITDAYQLLLETPTAATQSAGYPILQLLNHDQQTQWRAMQGAPFAFTALRSEVSRSLNSDRPPTERQPSLANRILE